MTSRYNRRHYEDVAIVLRNAHKNWSDQFQAPVKHLMFTFADLFAADNPNRCIDCGCRQGSSDRDPECSSHLFAGGFDRDRFLAACGLEEETS